MAAVKNVQKFMGIKRLAVFSLLPVIFGGCSTMDMSKGGSVVSGSASNNWFPG